MDRPARAAPAKAGPEVAPAKAAPKAPAKAAPKADPPKAAPAEAEASTLPARPMEVGSRVKAAAPPPVPPPASADSRSGEYDYRNGESSRQRQWRLHGVWRKRAGKHVDWYNEQYRK